jgi:hypothetical protein
MNTRATKGQPAKTNEFKCVYDARKTLRDKALLQQVNVGQLKVHDFVVMEARLGRYAVKEEGAPDIKGKRRAMDRWQAFYDLQAVYKIKDAAGRPCLPEHFVVILMNFAIFLRRRRRRSCCRGF